MSGSPTSCARRKWSGRRKAGSSCGASAQRSARSASGRCVVEQGLHEARAELERAAAADPARAAARQEELRQVEQQMAHLMALVKMAGPVSAVAAEFKALERRRSQLAQAAGPVGPSPAAVDLDRLRALLAEWRERIRGEMPMARQMLRVLFPDRIVFKPDSEQQTVELRATCAVGSVFERLLIPKTVVTPAGFEPAISTLKGSRPWPG